MRLSFLCHGEEIPVPLYAFVPRVGCIWDVSRFFSNYWHGTTKCDGRRLCRQRIRVQTKRIPDASEHVPDRCGPSGTKKARQKGGRLGVRNKLGVHERRNRPPRRFALRNSMCLGKDSDQQSLSGPASTCPDHPVVNIEVSRKTPRHESHAGCIREGSNGPCRLAAIRCDQTFLRRSRLKPAIPALRNHRPAGSGTGAGPGDGWVTTLPAW